MNLQDEYYEVHLQDEYYEAQRIYRQHLENLWRAKNALEIALAELQDREVNIREAHGFDPKAIGGDETTRKAKIAHLASNEIACVRTAETNYRARQLELDKAKSIIKSLEFARDILINKGDTANDS